MSIIIVAEIKPCSVDLRPQLVCMYGVLFRTGSQRARLRPAETALVQMKIYSFRPSVAVGVTKGHFCHCTIHSGRGE